MQQNIFKARILEFKRRFKSYVPGHVRQLVVEALYYCKLHNEALTSDNKSDIELGTEWLTISTSVLGVFGVKHRDTISSCFHIITDSFCQFLVETNFEKAAGLYYILGGRRRVRDVFKIETPSRIVNPEDAILESLFGQGLLTGIIHQSSSKRILHVKNDTDIELLQEKIDQLTDELPTLEIDIIARDDTVSLITRQQIM